MLFSGRVHTVIHGNPKKDFYILKVVLDTVDPDSGFSKGSFAVVRGNVIGLSVTIGSMFSFLANPEMDPKYGLQLKILRAPIYNHPLQDSDVKSLLVSAGISEGTVSYLQTSLGDSLLEFLNTGNGAMLPAKISTESAEKILSAWKVMSSYADVMGFLHSADLPTSSIAALWRAHGSQTKERLLQNTWQTCASAGLSLSMVKLIARLLQVELTEEEILDAAIMQVLLKGNSEGNTYFSGEELRSRVIPHLHFDVDARDIASSLKRLHENRSVVIDPNTLQGTFAIYERTMYLAESSSANMLADRVRLHQPTNKDVASIVEEVCARSIFSLTQEQKSAVQNALSFPVSILTGCPGTGKTTCLRTIVEALQKTGESILLLAPTGIAAKRVSSVVGIEAHTIHRALGAPKVEDDTATTPESSYAGQQSSAGSKDTIQAPDESSNWNHNIANPHPASVVIVDEASMVSQKILYRLLQGTSRVSRIIFVGDAAQLPSVDAGAVLQDLIRSGKFPVCHLNQIFRQDEASSIILAAHAVCNGTMPSTYDENFRIVEASSDEELLQPLIEKAKQLAEKKESFQVLTPKHGGILGATLLNEVLRDTLNPQKGDSREVLVDVEAARVGDKVIFAKNDYKLEVFNGDIGIITSVNPLQITCKVDIELKVARHITIPVNALGGLLRLAYAVTVHRFQGKEVDHVLLPLTESMTAMLYRNLLYTAITRAKKTVTIFGSKDALYKAVLDVKSNLRKTLFAERLLKSI